MPSSRDDDHPHPKRTTSGSFVGKLFRRHTNAGRTTPSIPSTTHSQSQSRSPSVAPSSPSLLPTTSTVTAGGSLVQPVLRSQSSPVQQSFDELAAWLSPQVCYSIPSQALASHIATLESMLRVPNPVTPSFDVIYPVLSYVCAPDVTAQLRLAGFSLMTAYIKSNPALLDDTSTALIRARLWYLIRNVHHAGTSKRHRGYILEDDWDNRFQSLIALSKDGEHIEGLIDIVVTLIHWSRDLIHSLRPLHSDPQSMDAASQRFDIERRLESVLRLTNDVYKWNISMLTEKEEDELIASFLYTVDVSLSHVLELGEGSAGSTNASMEPLPLSPRAINTTSLLTRAPSRGRIIQETSAKGKHRRHNSSQSSRLPFLSSQPSTPTIDTPNEAPSTDVSYSVQVAAFLCFMKTLTSSGPLPSKRVYPAIRTLVLVMATVSSDLPKVTNISKGARGSLSPLPRILDAEQQLAVLESSTWEVLSTLLSGSYAATTAREIKRFLLLQDIAFVEEFSPRAVALCSRGAARIIRLALRKGATHRIAVSRLETSDDPYSPSGMPVFSQDTEEVLQTIYGVGAGGSVFWDAPKVRGLIGRAIKTWLDLRPVNSGTTAVITECLGIAADVFDEVTATSRSLTEDEAHVVGEILSEAAKCFEAASLLPPESPEFLHQSQLLENVASLLYSMPMDSPLSPSPTEILLSIPKCVSDEKGVAIVDYTFKESLPFPSTARWLPTIMDLLAKLNRPDMPLCRRALAHHIRQSYEEVRDLSDYRDPLVRISLNAWERTLILEDNPETVQDIWAVLGDGIVAGAAEQPFTENLYVRPPQAWSATGLDQRIQAIIVNVANSCDCPDETALPVSPESADPSPHPSQTAFTDTDHSRSPSLSPKDSTLTSPPISPGLQPLYKHAVTPQKSSTNVRSRGIEPSKISESPQIPHDQKCKSMSAVLTLISTFSRLAFSPPHSLDSDSPFKTARAPASTKCITVWENLLSLVGPTVTTTSLPEGEERPTGHKKACCRRARLAILQWTLRLRADRDHRLYVLENVDHSVDPFASLVKRGIHDGNVSTPADTEREARRPRGSERDRIDADSPGRNRTPGQSRSKSRLPTSPREPAPVSNPDPIWGLPDVLPFDIPDGSRPSEGMTTYSADHMEHDGVTRSLWLSVSLYVCILTDIIQDETDWEIFSYTLCHLPLQLSNKHLFCGPRTRKTIGTLLTVLCNGVLKDRLGSNTQLPTDLKLTDVVGLGYQTLTILVGYRDSFDTLERILSESLVQAFCQGLSRHYTIAKPCLQALSICAWELQSALAKFMPQVLDQVVQVISNPAISRHILELLAVIGTIPALYANLHEAHFNLIFTAAGRYIQRHNRPMHISMSSTGIARVGSESFALSQHVLVLAYYVIYIWFLGIRLSERPRYIRSIARHLLIANDGQPGMTEMTEVCFDWLARYTYSNASPRPSEPTHSIPTANSSKTWLVGNSLLTVENLPRAGWVAVTSRRPSGVIHITSRIDNITMERLEDVDPRDLLPIIERGHKNDIENATASLRGQNSNVNDLDTGGVEESTPEVAGMTFPSKSGVSTPRIEEPESPRSDVAMHVVPTAVARDLELDPGFLPLQLSQYPHSGVGTYSPILLASDETVRRAIRVLDVVPVVDLHKIGVMYAAPGQTTEAEILGNEHGSPAYTRFLHGLGHLIEVTNPQKPHLSDLDRTEGIDGHYAYAWWDDVVRIIYHASTMMPNMAYDPSRTLKKRHIGNDWVRIVWNDSGVPYRFDTLSTEFQLVNIVIEPHSTGTIAAYSNSSHENEFFKVILQRAPGMPEFGPVGEFKLLSALNLPAYVRQVSLLASLFAQVYAFTNRDTTQEEYVTNWRKRLQMIKKLRPVSTSVNGEGEEEDGANFGDFTVNY